MKSRTGRRLLVIALLCMLLTAVAVPAFAASYSKVYGQTQDKVRVRENGSANATMIDMIAKNACVYIVNSKTSGHYTYVQVRYRGFEGNVLTGWICQTDGDDTYVKILSATQAQKVFGVKDGNLPSKKVGLYDQKRRNEAKNGSGGSSSSSSSSNASASSATIKDVQSKLKALKIYSGEVTGNAGDKTVAAIKAFQKRYGLTADGVAGKKTVEKLNEVYKSKGSPKGGSSSSGSSGSKAVISEMQSGLKRLGIYAGEVTGNAGEKTVAAIKAFQKKYGLTADGVAGTETVAKLRSVVGTSSSSGSSSGKASISEVQTKLKALSFYSGEITGNAGDKTVAAIRAFQAKYGLTVDGVAGAKTVAKINEVYKSRGGSSSASTVAYTTSGTMKLGSTGSAVKTLQENLKSLGMYSGDITGHFGSQTEAAVKAVQKKKGLSQTGVANKTTLNAIASMMGGSYSSSGGSSSITSYGRTNAASVTLRSDHSTSSSPKVSLELGTPLKITKKYTAGNKDVWYYVSARKNGYTYRGYVYGGLVTIISYADYMASSGGNGSSDEVLGLIRVASDGVALREGDSQSSGKVGTANSGDMFYYTDLDDGWYKLSNGYYIMAKFCKRVSDSEANSFNNSTGSGSYQSGDTGSMVSWIQQRLKDLGFYSGSVTGHFGTKTTSAVVAFQNKKGLTADGIVGSRTLAALQDNGSNSNSGNADVNIGGKIYNLNWFKAKDNGVLPKLGLLNKKHAKLMDLRTGKSLNIYIQSAGNHLDVEPLAASDTQKLCSIYGVSSANYINYVRRPMLLTTDTGAQIVCSIYATPHGKQEITNNNFPGQFCLHFLNSKTHGSGKVDPDHMSAIQEAISLVGSGKVSTISDL